MSARDGKPACAGRSSFLDASVHERSGGRRPGLAQEARRVLRRLAENGAYLCALGAKDFGLFVRRNRWARPVLKLDGAIFKCLAAEGFVAPLAQRRDGGARYAISAEGEAFLRRATVPDDPFSAQHRVWGTRQIEDRARGQSARHQVNLAETPLGWLAGRRDRSGKPFITLAQYEAGERLREDFTRAQLMHRVTVDWSLPLSGDALRRPSKARSRIRRSRRAGGSRPRSWRRATTSRRSSSISAAISSGSRKPSARAIGPSAPQKSSCASGSRGSPSITGSVRGTIMRRARGIGARRFPRKRDGAAARRRL